MISITTKQMSKIYFFFYRLCRIKEVISSYGDYLFFQIGKHHHQAHFDSYGNHDTIRKYWRNKWFLINT